MPNVNAPEAIFRALASGADLVVSISGGKDSQAMLSACVRFHRERKLPGRILAVHADLGRMEWGGYDQTSPFATLPQVRQQCEALGVDLVVVQRNRGDLLARMQERRDTLAGSGKPFWPSSGSRYCTSDLKRDPIDTFLRTFDGPVVCAVGVRAEESANRAKMTCWQPRKRITTQSRTGFTWHPIHAWTLDDVWAELGVSRAFLKLCQEVYPEAPQEALEAWPAHPAYVLGNERLSCALCVVYGSLNDLVNGARHNPELFAELRAMEDETGYTFRADHSLADVARALQQNETK